MRDALLRSVTARTLLDSRRSLIGYAIGLTLLILMMGIFWPTIRDQGDQFQQLLESYPPEMMAFFGDFSEFTTAGGFLRAELYSLTLPLLVLLFAIGRTADAFAGEEERGGLEALLSHPITRRRAYLEKAAGVALGVAAIVLVSTLTVLLINGVRSMGLSIGGILAQNFMLLLLGLAHIGVTLAVAGARGRKGLAVALASTFAVGSWLLSSFGNLLDALKPARAASVFAHYSDTNPFTQGIDVPGVAVLLLVAAITTGIGLWMFERRDVGV